MIKRHVVKSNAGRSRIFCAARKFPLYIDKKILCGEIHLFTEKIPQTAKSSFLKLVIFIVCKNILHWLIGFVILENPLIATTLDASMLHANCKSGKGLVGNFPITAEHQ